MKRKDKDGLQSRREFFKKAAKSALPILAISVFGTSLFSACGKDEEEEMGDKNNNPGGCNNCASSCSGSCDNTCSGGCDENCSAHCAYNCGSSSYYS